MCDRVTAVWGDAVPHVEHHHAQLPVFGLGVMLLGGSFVQHFFEKLPVPYTAMCLLYGGLLGVWVLFSEDFTLQPGMGVGDYAGLQCNVTSRIPNDLYNHGSHLGNSLRVIGEMDPHLMLHLVLPPLLFESAFAIDWHIFAKIATNALTLAAPGLVVATGLTGLLYLALYSWRWEAAMLAGGILSATDPVAVVALLRAMGVKKSLATLIEAESLMNDGTAVVVFTIFLKATRAGSLLAWLNAQGLSAAHVAWVAFRMSVIGPIWGIACAGATLTFLHLNAYKDRDSSVEMVVTIAMPYLVFYSAESAWGDEFQMSGVLAVVAFGLTFASPWGRANIDPHAEHFLHGFWSSIGHLVNTLIFIISGLTIALRFDAESDSIDLGREVGRGFVVYLFLTLCRALLMFGFIPVFRRGLYGFDWRDALVISWGGLRGAVGLALALAVASDHLIRDCDDASASGSGASAASGSSADAEDACVAHAQEIKSVIMVHTCLVVVLTLLINAPTAKPLLRAIGLTRLGDQERSMIVVARQKLRRVEVDALERLYHTPINEEANWEGVQALAGLEAILANVCGDKAPTVEDLEKRRWQPPLPTPSDTPTQSVAMVSAIYGRMMHRTQEWSHKAQVINHWRVLYKYLRDQLLAEQNPVSSSPERTTTNGLRGGDGFGQMVGRLHARQLHEARHRLLYRIKMHMKAAFELGLIGKNAVVVLLEAVDHELTLLRLGKHSNREILPFHAIARAASPRFGTSRYFMRLGDALDWAAQWAPGPLGAMFERWTQNMYLRGFRGSYDVAVGYLVAHEELMEEELHSPSSFALNDEVNRRSVEMVEQNIKAAAKHVQKLRHPGGPWASMCSVLDTVRVAHSLMNALESAVSSMGHHGNLAETETERLLDLLLERKLWLQQHTANVSAKLTSALPDQLMSQMTTRGRMRNRTTLRTLPLPFAPASAEVELGPSIQLPERDGDQPAIIRHDDSSQSSKSIFSA